jgi:hypothetical protein
MFERRYSDGDPIYLAGDASDAVFRIRRGKVRAEIGPLGHPAAPRMLGPGDLFGAVQLLSGVARNENTYAVGDVILDTMTRAELLRLLEADPAALQVALNALFDHLKVAADAARVHKANGRSHDAGAARSAPIRLFGANKHVLELIGPDGLVIGDLPFRVGRRSPNGSALKDSVHLQLADSRPYFMSRRHFAIERDAEGLIVRDCGSHSGTLVNGTPIGAAAPSDVAPLTAGRNEIVAGKPESPFRFMVIVETTDAART